MKKLYIGNLTFGVTEPDLRSIFEPYGKVESSTLVTDQDTGRSRGFGFVEMTKDSEAEAAIRALNGQESNGRPLTVNEARPRADRPKRQGAGRGRW